MALMLRFLGIPARVAAGFTSGTYDRKAGTWTVTDHDAHTWVEVWFDGLGWVPFDPTPGRGTLPGAYTAASPRFDASAAAVPLVGLLGLSSGALKSRLERAARQGLARGARVGVPSASSTGGARSVVRRRGPGLLALVALVLLGLAAAIAFGKTAVRRARYATRDPRRTAAACRRELAEFLADQGVSVEASAAPADLARLVRRKFSVDGAAFARALAAARYGPPASAAAEAGAARRELRRLRRALRRRLAVRDRALGLLSLRSLTG
jgi:hypothetical protein